MNIAEILKYCPKGTKLYSTVFGEVEFSKINPDDMIVINVKDNGPRVFLRNGSYSKYGECVLFPSKDQKDWKKFRLPVKRGDIMMMPDGSFPFITNGTITKSGGLEYVCGVLSVSGNFRINSTRDTLWAEEFCIPASEEAKKELFDKMAEAGYKWNADTLELEKIELKFKEGDFIKNKQGTIYLISKILDGGNTLEMAAVLNKEGLTINPNVWQNPYDKLIASIEDKNKLLSTLVREGYKYDQEQHKLVKQKFKPFDKVLVRNSDFEHWKIDFYSTYIENKSYHYICASNNYKICIPYEGNEYLLGTTDSPE